MWGWLAMQIFAKTSYTTPYMVLFSPRLISVACTQLLDHMRKADVVRMMEDKKEDSPQRGSAVRTYTDQGTGMTMRLVDGVASSSVPLIAVSWVSLGNPFV
jgi:hypothetical protein